MTKEELFQWRLTMGYRNQNEAAEALGIHRNALNRMEKGHTRIEKRTALACTALYHRLKPWSG